MFCTLPVILMTTVGGAAFVAAPPRAGLASWCGEEHRGKLMANGQPFNPDEFTAASWFYPFGTRVRVSALTGAGQTNSVEVTITDRGPAHRLVQDEGRIIDLSLVAFQTLAPPSLGLIRVRLESAAETPHESGQE